MRRGQTFIARTSHALSVSKHEYFVRSVTGRSGNGDEVCLTVAMSLRGSVGEASWMDSVLGELVRRLSESLTFCCSSIFIDCVESIICSPKQIVGWR